MAKMKKIILSGCNGSMGKVVSCCAAERDDVKIVAGIDLQTDSNYGYPIYSSPDQIDCKADVLIDFSNPFVIISTFGIRQTNKNSTCTLHNWI
jgi:4-hydroxy-tetrahydrodipicolinate reductase